MLMQLCLSVCREQTWPRVFSSVLLFFISHFSHFLLMLGSRFDVALCSFVVASFQLSFRRKLHHSLTYHLIRGNATELMYRQIQQSIISTMPGSPLLAPLCSLVLTYLILVSTPVSLRIFVQTAVVMMMTFAFPPFPLRLHLGVHLRPPSPQPAAIPPRRSQMKTYPVLVGGQS